MPRRRGNTRYDTGSGYTGRMGETYRPGSRPSTPTRPRRKRNTTADTGAGYSGRMGETYRPGTTRMSPGEVVRYHPSNAGYYASKQAYKDFAADNPGEINDPATNPMSDLMALLTGAGLLGSGSPSSGRGSGGGGGGGGGGPDVDALRRGYAGMLGTMGDEAINKQYGDLEGKLRGAQAEGRARLQGIYDDLMARNATARAGVGSAFDAGAAGLRDVGARYGAATQGGLGQLNDILAAQGATPSLRSTGALADLIGANEASLAGARANYDLSQADRAAAYAALQGDVASGHSQGFDALLSQVASQRTAALQAQEQARQKILMEMASQGIELFPGGGFK